LALISSASRTTADNRHRCPDPFPTRRSSDLWGDRRRDEDRRRRAAGVPQGTGRAGERGGHPLLRAPEGHDDEGLRPDHLRPHGQAFFADVFAKYGEELAAAGLSANDGLGGIFAGLENLENGAEIRAAFDAALAQGPE